MKLKLLLVAMSSLLYLSQSCEAAQTGQTVLQITSQPITSLPELSNVQVITPEAAQTLSTTQTKVLSTAAISPATVKIKEAMLLVDNNDSPILFRDTL